MKKSSKLVLVVLLVMVLSVASYAFAATNTVPATVAGDGEGLITGYTVNTITYVLDGTDPSLITGVSFSLLPAADATAKVHAKLSGGTATPAWSTDCDLTGTTWTCDFAGFSVKDAALLRVVAAQ